MIYYIKQTNGQNAYYAKTKLIATSGWVDTGGYRGHFEVKPEQGYKIVKSDWVTGNWADAPYGHSESEVEALLKKLESKYGKIYVILTETSNVFSTSYDVLIETGEPKLKAKTVAHKTKLIQYNDGWGVRYHATEVVRYNKNDNTYTIDTGGWYSRTTKKRINDYLPRPLTVYQKNFKFYLHTPDKEVLFDKPLTIKEARVL